MLTTQIPAEHAWKVRGVDFVMYQVSDLAKAASFYRETLGLAQELYSEQWQWAEFNCGNITLALHGGAKISKKPPGARIALAVNDIQAAYEQLRSKGVNIENGVKDFSVCRSVEILDPDGNTVLLHQRTDGTFGPGSP